MTDKFWAYLGKGLAVLLTVFLISIGFYRVNVWFDDRYIQDASLHYDIVLQTESLILKIFNENDSTLKSEKNLQYQSFKDSIRGLAYKEE